MLLPLLLLLLLAAKRGAATPQGLIMDACIV
jgi:hypothetical protein